jgi:hypothetical protein
MPQPVRCRVEVQEHGENRTLFVRSYFPRCIGLSGRVYIKQRDDLRLMDNRRGIVGNRECIRAQGETEGPLRNHWRRGILIL